MIFFLNNDKTILLTQSNSLPYTEYFLNLHPNLARTNEKLKCTLNFFKKMACFENAYVIKFTLLEVISFKLLICHFYRLCCFNTIPQKFATFKALHNLNESPEHKTL